MKSLTDINCALIFWLVVNLAALFLIIRFVIRYMKKRSSTQSR